ncbi:MAG: class I SAM-dependent methyltransferase [Proteobacteria bacterium]|nr:class I SAM-dependent methyltransferase [Pseudomonadota bacterium]
MKLSNEKNDVQTEGGYYRARLNFDPKRHLVWQAITEDLQKRFIEADGMVVDLGCGYGDFINQVKAKRKIAIDLEDVAAFLAKEVEFHRSDAADLDFLTSGTVDTLFVSNLLEHLPRDESDRLLSQIERILKPGGKLITIQPNFKRCYKEYFDDYTHQTIFTDESLCGLLVSHGFSIAYRKAGYIPFSMQGLLPKSYWLTKIYLSLGLPFLAKQMLVVGVKPLIHRHR